jgi:uncharacterized membrane protein YebE (DUF533 family)
MLHFVAAVCLLSVVSMASAGDYSRAVAQQERCEKAGSAARDAFAMNKDERKALLQMIKAKIADGKIDKKHGEQLQDYVILAVISDSPREAYMRAWADCMDKK